MTVEATVLHVPGLEILSLAGMALATVGYSLAVVHSAGQVFNFKPFNCLFCLTFWHATCFMAVLAIGGFLTIPEAATVVGIAIFLGAYLPGVAPWIMPNEADDSAEE
jgi:hypothetical protein